ncbi:2-(S)-hydroxypropyl-CoM dehydrogenase [Coniella lustricola]|uniref:2-(S)-hydroxypropyl-CoM dehydrogenase n=1 Tax=Coniella lustricola TaxID=2025994 RepID=A0A2T3A0F1_9PEZI|nr:2-(S)-hydroxypropyl-CoM dehydrogenase [Coniella lustricola]
MSHLCQDPPSRSLSGKVAIVTGAGSAGDGIGNGRAISIMLADEGCNVVCVDRERSWAERTCTMANSKSGRARAITAIGDVSKAADCEAIMQRAIQEFGRLDILVNNVGTLGPHGTAVEVDMEQWAKGLEVNVSSMVLMAKYAIPVMLRNNVEENKGVIINMGSVAGLRGGTPHLLYPTSKGAVVNMTRAMAAHHAKDGIRVNCVCPGMLYTPMMYSGGMSEEVKASRQARSLLGTEGTGWDCACAVTFLASNHARWITGVALPVDAGTTAATASTLTQV